jgi:hypothetical protein
MNRERLYWIGVGAGILVLLVLYFAWVRPARNRVESEEATFTAMQRRLDDLNRKRTIMPSANSLSEMRDYKAWIDDEQRRVIAFFADSDATLEMPLVPGQENPSENAFKGAYDARRRKIEADLRNRVRGIVLPPTKNLFSPYAWADSGALPSPADYKEITNGINIREELLTQIAECEAVEIRTLDVKKPVKADALYDVIPVSFSGVIPADKVSQFVRGILQVSRRQNKQGLCMAIRSLHIGKQSTPPLRQGVNVDIELDVLDFPNNLAKLAAPPAVEKAATPASEKKAEPAAAPKAGEAKK